jgi:hypothetical protein
MLSLEFTDQLPGGGTVRATLYGAAADREALVFTGVDALLLARRQVSRVRAPFATPTPLVPSTSQPVHPQAEFACQNYDGERIA